MSNNSNKDLVANTGQNLAEINSKALSSLDAKLEFAEKLISAKSSLVPYKTAGDVLVVLQAAQDFNIPITAAMNNIYPINGRASVGVHFIQAILLKNGITFKVLKNYAPIYEWKGFGGIDVTQEEVDANPDAYNRIGPKTDKKDYAKDKINVLRTKVIDWETVIEFYRKVKQPDGTFKDMSVIGRFSISDAERAGLIQDKGHTWGKYPKAMLRARAMMDGAKQIADDLILGLSEVSEAGDTFDVDYELTDDGNTKPTFANDINFNDSDIEDITIEE